MLTHAPAGPSLPPRRSFHLAAATVVRRAVAVCAALLVSVTVLASSAQAADWQNSLTKDPPGKFPPLRPLHAKYSFGWSGFTAATAEVNFTRAPQDRHVVLEGTG